MPDFRSPGRMPEPGPEPVRGLPEKAKGGNSGAALRLRDSGPPGASFPASGKPENLDDWFAMPPGAADGMQLTPKGMADFFSLIEESYREKIPLEEWAKGEAGLVELGEVIEAAWARRLERDA